MNEVDITVLGELLETKNFRALRELLDSTNEVDIAIFMADISAENAMLVFRMLQKELAAEVFAQLSAETQGIIIGSINDSELRGVIEELFIDDMVDMLEELPAGVVKRILKNATPDTRELINQFLKYEKNSAGSIMTAEFIDLHKDMSVSAAFERIKRTAVDKETIYTCYVMDDRRHLEGVVSVRALFLAGDGMTIKDIMETGVISVLTDDDKESAARLLAKYGLLSIPVVDKENRLVGIVTVDDAVDVITEEATEDFQKMAGTFPSEKPYLKTGVVNLAKNRIVWLLVLMVSSMITGTVLQSYEGAFAVLPLLVTFIPMLTDTGGNAGSQSSTLIIRGLALGEIHMGDFLRVLWKELRVSLLVGAALCAVNYIRLAIMYPGSEGVALTVVLTLFATVILSKTIGGLLPIVAKRVNIDPAIMAAPLITTIVDAFSLVIYFSIAKAVLNI